MLDGVVIAKKIVDLAKKKHKQCMIFKIDKRRHLSFGGRLILLKSVLYSLPEGIRRVIGNGKEIYFWKHAWCERSALKDTYQRLFSVLGQKCVLCNKETESTIHLFFSCSASYLICQLCYRWFGIQTVLPEQGKQHFTNHSGIWKKKK
uniref:Reverse transcriptase zinc-binding domain-containing protein n=1 Tax=Cajanus cajan TaxID=3821 RepID=A0A151R5V2_CAJCA|nr:hypothetical protein KK1_040916 [Cajanus cajan]